MKKYTVRSSVAIAGFALFASAFGLAACSNHTVHVPGVGSIKYSKNGSNVTITSHGNSFSESNSMPSDFPSSVPLPKGYQVLGSMGGNNAATASSAASSYFDIYLAVSGTPQSAGAAYANQLQSNGFTISSQQSVNEGGTNMDIIEAKSGQWDITASFGSAQSYSSKLKAGQTEVGLVVSSSSS
jgi:hypothetical protein